MKKIISAFLAVAALCASITSCGAGSQDDNVLVMATNANFPPYEYHEGDKIVGIDAEIAEKIAEELGMEFWTAQLFKKL